MTTSHKFFGIDVTFEEEEYLTYAATLDHAELSKSPTDINELKQGIFEFQEIIAEALPEDFEENESAVVKLDASTIIRLKEVAMLETYMKEKNIYYND